jgi:ZIP family zinc transporter
VTAAFLWGAIGAAALLVGAVVAYAFDPGQGIIALVMALGSGLLIGSVSFELIDDAVSSTSVASVGAMALVGAVVFTGGDWLLQWRGGGDRKDASGAQAAGSAMAIVLGSVLDGIPESFVLGLTVKEGGVSPALLVGILLSNLPEGMGSSSGLKAAHWPTRKVMGMWSIVIVVSAISAALGYAALDPSSGNTGGLVQAFAAGALLAMIADTMLPEAFKVEGIFTGPLVVVGFAASIILSAL